MAIGDGTADFGSLDDARRCAERFPYSAEIIPFPVTAVQACPATEPHDETLLARLALSVAVESGWLEPCTIFGTDGSLIDGYRYTEEGYAQVGDVGFVSAACALAQGRRS